MTNGTAVPLERAVDELRKYRRGLRAMSGGLTVSGGEPLLQDRFAVRLCAAAKAMGVHTAVETNGYLGERLSDADLDQIDLVLFGLKSWGAAHHDLTGKVLYTVPIDGFSVDSAEFTRTPNHGIALSPDERRLYLIDVPNGYVHVFDVQGLPASPPTLSLSCPASPVPP